MLLLRERKPKDCLINYHFVPFQNLQNFKQIFYSLELTLDHKVLCSDFFSGKNSLISKFFQKSHNCRILIKHLRLS